jgi:hypothetical protein
MVADIFIKRYILNSSETLKINKIAKDWNILNHVLGTPCFGSCAGRKVIS